MKEKKLLTIITFTISIVLFLIYFPYMMWGDMETSKILESFCSSECSKKTVEICTCIERYCTAFSRFKDVTLAVMGSAFVGFVMSLIEYFQSKKVVMQKFYSDTLDLLHQIQKIRYFKTDVPENVVICAIVENDVNIWNQRILQRLHNRKKVYRNAKKQKEYQEIEQSILSEMKTMYKNRFLEEYLRIYPNYSKIFLQDEKIYEDIIRPYKDQLCECMRSYVEVANYGTKKLESDLEEIDFIFPHKKYKEESKGIVFQMYSILSEIQRYTWGFECYIENSKNASAACSKILHLNEYCFEVDKTATHTIISRKKVKEIFSTVFSLTYRKKPDLQKSLEVLNTIVYSSVALDKKGDPME